MQTQVQSLAFSREIAEKTKIVSESSEVVETTVDTDTQDSQGSATDSSLAGKHKHGRNKREKKISPSHKRKNPGYTRSIVSWNVVYYVR